MSSEVGQWNTELFSCTEDWTTCCHFFWNPCCAYAEQGQLVFGNSRPRYIADVCLYFILCAFRLEWTVGTVRREDIRIKYNIPAGPYDDLLVHCCCHLCAACQETRKLKSFFRTSPDVASGPSTRGDNGDDPNLPAVTFERHVDYVMSGGIRKDAATYGNIARKRRAARRLGDIALESGNKDSIVSGGGIGPLVDLLKSRDRECRSNAVFAIAALADDLKSRMVIIEEGGLSALVRLLAYGGHREKACAARTLGTICADDKSARETVRTEGGIPMLVRLLKSTNIMSAHSAAMALAHISTSSPDLTLISLLNSEGGIAPLIRLLQRGDEHTRMWATIVISHIADDEESQQEIINESGVKFILYQLRSRLEDSRLNAAHALASLCEKSDQIQEEIVLEQGVRDLVLLLDDINDVCREQAALVLNILSKNSKHYINVIQEGAVPKCLKLLDSNCEFCRESASCLLANLSCKEEGCNALVQHGGVQKMLDLVEVPDELTRSNIICILANLGQSSMDRQLSIVRKVAFPF